MPSFPVHDASTIAAAGIVTLATGAAVGARAPVPSRRPPSPPALCCFYARAA